MIADFAPSLPALVTTLAIHAFAAMAVLTPPIFAPVAASEMGVEAAQTGVLMAITYTAACLASLLSGALLSKFSALRLSQICLILCAGGVALMAAAHLAAVLAGGLLLGLGYGPVTPASSQLLARQAPASRRSLMFSIKQTGVPLGGMLAGSTLPVLTLQLGWRSSAIIVAFTGLVLAVAVEPLRHWLQNDETSPASERHSGIFGGIHLVLHHRALRRLVIASLGFAAVQTCFGVFLTAYLTTQIDFDLISAGAVLAAAQGAGIGGRILWGWMTDRFVSPRRMLALLGTAMTVATFLLALFTTSWSRAAVFAIALAHGAAAIGWNGVYFAEVARLVPPALAGAATGGALALAFLGTILGPPLFSVVLETTESYRAAFCLVAAITLFGSLQLSLSKSLPRAEMD